MNNKRIKTIVKLVLLIAISVCGLVGGFLDAKVYGLTFFEEKKFTVNIDDEEDIKEMGRSFHNNDCFLTSDIETNEVQGLASSENPYVGTFDGRGYTIRIKGGLQEPFFGYVGEGGVIKNLTVIVDATTLENNKFAIFATQNEGSIYNCKIIVENMQIERLGTYAGVSAYNYGSIKNVYVECKLTKALDGKNQARDKVGGIKAGGICAYNYGEVDGCIAFTEFEGFKEVKTSEQYNGGASNYFIGALIGVNNGNGNVKNCATSVKEDVYVSDQKNEGIAFLKKEEIFSEETLFTELGFDEYEWELLKLQDTYEFRLKGEE